MTNPPMPPISTTGNDRFSKILFWVGILIIPTILIIQVLVYQPFFGHMEDGSRLRLLSSNSGLGEFWTFAQQTKDLYGFALNTTFSESLTYMAYAGATVDNATNLYLVNVVLVLSLSFFFVASFAMAGNLCFASILAGTVAALLWPFSFEMIFFPSLHEKGILLSVGLIFFCSKMLAKIGSNGVVLLSTTALVALSTTTKPQVLVFYPAACLFILILNYYSQRLNAARIISLITPFVVSSILLGTQSLIGSDYVNNQRNVNLGDNLQRPYAVLILGIVVAYGAYVGVRFLRGRRNYLDLVPLVMMATFWASIVYFGYRNYFLSIFGVMFGSAVAVVVGNLKSMRLQQLATVGLIVVTVGWTLYRIPQVFEPLHGIGAFTQGQIAKDLADEGAVIYTSCVEGSGHFNYYTERKWGVTPEFKPLEGDGAGYRFGIPDDGQYVFGDRRLCAAPGEIAEWDVVWASPGDDGFRLYKRPA